MTLQLRVPGATFDGPALVTIDPILPAVGALALYDFAHPLTALAPGVPASGAAIRNLARDASSVLTGAAPSLLDATMFYAGLAGSDGLLERSAKGGLHVIMSAAQVATTAGFQLRLNKLGWIAWMKANPSHQFYWSLWSRPTRVATAAQTISSSSSSNATFGQHIGKGGPLGGFTAVADQAAASVGAAGTPMLRARVTKDIAVGYQTGTDDVAANHSAMQLDNIRGLNNLAGNVGKHGAHVFYRFYAEDLTSSGRTPAEVLALDNALFAQEVLTAGGRYYADSTPTNPATIP